MTTTRSTNKGGLAKGRVAIAEKKASEAKKKSVAKKDAGVAKKAAAAAVAKAIAAKKKKDKRLTASMKQLDSYLSPPNKKGTPLKKKSPPKKAGVSTVSRRSGLVQREAARKASSVWKKDTNNMKGTTTNVVFTPRELFPKDECTNGKPAAAIAAKKSRVKPQKMIPASPIPKKVKAPKTVTPDTSLTVGGFTAGSVKSVKKNFDNRAVIEGFGIGVLHIVLYNYKDQKAAFTHKEFRAAKDDDEWRESLGILSITKRKGCDGATAMPQDPTLKSSYDWQSIICIVGQDTNTPKSRAGAAQRVLDGFAARAKEFQTGKHPNSYRIAMDITAKPMRSLDQVILDSDIYDLLVAACGHLNLLELPSNILHNYWNDIDHGRNYILNQGVGLQETNNPNVSVAPGMILPPDSDEDENLETEAGTPECVDNDDALKPNAMEDCESVEEIKLEEEEHDDNVDADNNDNDDDNENEDEDDEEEDDEEDDDEEDDDEEFDDDEDGEDLVSEARSEDEDGDELTDDGFIVPDEDMPEDDIPIRKRFLFTHGGFKHDGLPNCTLQPNKEEDAMFDMIASVMEREENEDTQEARFTIYHDLLLEAMLANLPPAKRHAGAARHVPASNVAEWVARAKRSKAVREAELIQMLKPNELVNYLAIRPQT